jgi:hypothetical protein
VQIKNVRADKKGKAGNNEPSGNLGPVLIREYNIIKYNIN